MSTPADDEATRIAQSLINTMVHLKVEPVVAVNAMAAALGCLVARAAIPGEADALMRSMASQAHLQMRLQLVTQRAEASGMVGHA